MEKAIPDTLQAADKTSVSDTDQLLLLKQIPEWTIVDLNKVKQLKRVYRFDNFSEAIAFTNRIADLAEQADHHPAIITEWGKVTVNWWTHRVKGLHINDYVMAQRSDHAYAGQRDELIKKKQD